MKKNICVFTGGRQEYGILRPLLNEFRYSKKINLKIIAAGMHLSNEFGLTYKEINRDGFKIHEKIESILSSDTPVSISKSMGILMSSLSESLQRLKPDYLVLLGDRYETFAAASCAFVAKIPIIHIQGGEKTVGAFDDGFRHSITKMSTIHFVYHDEYKKRVIQLGENPKKVINYGGLNIDSIKKTSLINKKELYDFFGINEHKKLILVTFHPITLEKDNSKKYMINLFNFLKKFNKTHIVIFTKTNADTQGRIINNLIDQYTKKYSNVLSFKSLGQIKYLSTLKYCEFVIGNSSSGVIETPYFKKSTINIGTRQQGRIKPINIVDSNYDTKSLFLAFKKISSSKFKNKIKYMKNPFYKPDTAKKICLYLEKLNKKSSTIKFFNDL